MSIEKFIKEKSVELGNKVHIAPDIHDKKMNNAIGKMAPNLDSNLVLAIIDTTVFRNAKKGCLFTGDCLYICSKGGERLIVKLSEIENVNYDNQNDQEVLIIKLKDNTETDLTKRLSNINVSILAEILNGVKQMADEGEEFKATSQIVPLSMMDVSIKKDYIRLICNFAFSNDNTIDASEYAEIMSLLVRIEIDSENRIQLREYMTNHEHLISNDELLKNLQKNLKDDSFKMIEKSLMKDILYILRTKNKNSDWHKNKFIIELLTRLNISEDQVELIHETIINDEEILNERKNDSEITKSMKDIASKATAVGVPMAAVYFSGSVIGVSAAGMTSGLATLGLGGVLGFSSMFTGVGVAVLIGVGTYKGLKRITSISDLENNKQRELMLQAIIRNSQKSLNYLIEDVNQIARQLTNEIRKVQETKVKIDKLTEVLNMLTKGAEFTSNKLESAEKEKIITGLPMKLNVSRVKELTNAPTKLNFREIVMSCYVKEVIENASGTDQLIYKLDDRLSIKELSDLKDILEGLGYNAITDATIASIKGTTKNWVTKSKKGSDD